MLCNVPTYFEPTAMRKRFELRYGYTGKTISKCVHVECTEKQILLVAKSVLRGQCADWMVVILGNETYTFLTA